MNWCWLCLVVARQIGVLLSASVWGQTRRFSVFSCSDFKQMFLCRHVESYSLVSHKQFKAAERALPLFFLLCYCTFSHSLFHTFNYCAFFSFACQALGLYCKYKYLQLYYLYSNASYCMSLVFSIVICGWSPFSFIIFDVLAVPVKWRPPTSGPPAIPVWYQVKVRVRLPVRFTSWYQMRISSGSECGQG